MLYTNHLGHDRLGVRYPFVVDVLNYLFDRLITGVNEVNGASEKKVRVTIEESRQVVRWLTEKRSK